MKYILMKYIFLLVVLVISTVAAQSVTVQKPVECVDTEALFQGLIGSDDKENPIWWGVEPGASGPAGAGGLSRYGLFVNEQTKSWTLIQFNEKIACVLGTGESSTLLFNGPKI